MEVIYLDVLNCTLLNVLKQQTMSYSNCPYKHHFNNSAVINLFHDTLDCLSINN